MTIEMSLQIAEIVSALDRRSWDEGRVKTWAGILQRAVEAERLPGELILFTAEELLREIEACDVSPAKLIKRAKEKPPRAWTQKHKRLAGPTDAWPKLFYPEGTDFVRTSRSEREAYLRSVKRWPESAVAQAMKTSQKGRRAQERAPLMDRAGEIGVKQAIESLKRRSTKADRTADAEPF